MCPVCELNQAKPNLIVYFEGFDWEPINVCEVCYENRPEYVKTWSDDDDED